MNGATGFDGCQAFDADLMESAMLGQVGPELAAHVDACHECRVALAGYQLTVRSIRSVATPPVPVLERPHIPRRSWVPRLLVAAAIAAAVLVRVHDARVVAPATVAGLPPSTQVASYSGSTSPENPIWNGTSSLDPVSLNDATPADDRPALRSDLPRAKMECIELGGGCWCCAGCDLQMLVGDDQEEHRIPASLQGLEIGIHVGVGTKLFPHGGFILAPDSALL